MTCTRLYGAIICTSPHGRLHVGNRYIIVNFHEYCGPTFFTDRDMSKVYEPKDENDPVWDAFGKWHEKFQAKKEAARLKREAARTTTPLPGA